jgi:hypothetical protein
MSRRPYRRNSDVRESVASLFMDAMVNPEDGIEAAKEMYLRGRGTFTPGEIGVFHSILQPWWDSEKNSMDMAVWLSKFANDIRSKERRKLVRLCLVACDFCSSKATPLGKKGISSLRSWMNGSFDNRSKIFDAMDNKMAHYEEYGPPEDHDGYQADKAIFRALNLSMYANDEESSVLAEEVFFYSAMAMGTNLYQIGVELRILANLIRKQIPDVPMLARLDEAARRVDEDHLRGLDLLRVGDGGRCHRDHDPVAVRAPVPEVHGVLQDVEARRVHLDELCVERLLHERLAAALEPDGGAMLVHSAHRHGGGRYHEDLLADHVLDAKPTLPVNHVSTTFFQAHFSRTCGAMSMAFCTSRTRFARSSRTAMAMLLADRGAHRGRALRGR